MNEADIVMELSLGASEEKVCIRYDITYKDIDAIMEVHGYQRCCVCGWWRSEAEPECLECGQ